MRASQASVRQYVSAFERAHRKRERGARKAKRNEIFASLLLPSAASLCLFTVTHTHTHTHTQSHTHTFQSVFVLTSPTQQTHALKR